MSGRSEPLRNPRGPWKPPEGASFPLASSLPLGALPHGHFSTLLCASVQSPRPWEESLEDEVDTGSGASSFPVPSHSFLSLSPCSPPPDSHTSLSYNVYTAFHRASGVCQNTGLWWSWL